MVGRCHSTPVHAPVKPDIRLDRALPIPIYLQLKGQLTYLISTGAVASGTKLPSIREMAEQLRLAPVTVAQAFRALGEQGLVEFRPGLGTFVVDLHSAGPAETERARLNRFVDRVIEEAHARRLPVQEVVQVLAARAGHTARREGPRVAFVGNFAADTVLSARSLEEALSDLGATVTPVPIDDLRADVEGALARIGDGAPVVSVPLHFAEVRRLLAAANRKVVGMTFVLSRVPQEQLALLPDETRIGIIATAPEYFASMATVVGLYRPQPRPPACAVVADERSVRRVLAVADTIVYAMGTRDQVRQLLPDDVQAIELLHEPDARSVARLREILQAEAPGVERKEGAPSGRRYQPSRRALSA